MHWAIYAVLVAGVLPLICAGIAKRGFKDYDNRDPRAWLDRQTGARQRANHAQANSLEAFPLFAAGMLLCMLAQVDAVLLGILGWVFVLMRATYIYAYVTNRASFRSLVWLIGYLVSIALYPLAAHSGLA